MLRNKTVIELFLAEHKHCALPPVFKGQSLVQTTANSNRFCHWSSHFAYGYQFASNSDH